MMTLIVFVAVYVTGNPAHILLSEDADAVEIERITNELGLHLPLWKQYLLFIQDFFKGEFGYSFVHNIPPFELIIEKLPATLELAIIALLVSIILGLPLGIYCALKPKKLISKALNSLSLLGFSIPNFWQGILLITLFSVVLNWFPPIGRGETKELFGLSWSFLTIDGIKHLFLPALNLAIFKTFLIMRMTKTYIQEIQTQNYIKFAIAKGLSPSRIVFVHILKIAMIPIITVLTMEFASIIIFATVTESVFSYPGIGKLLVDSMLVLDRPVIVCYLMGATFLLIVMNFCADLLYTLLDPRLRVNAKEI